MNRDKKNALPGKETQKSTSKVNVAHSTYPVKPVEKTSAEKSKLPLLNNGKVVDLIPFHFGSELIQATEAGGEVWVLGKQACDALEIRNTRDAIGGLDYDEKANVAITDVSSSSRKTITVQALNQSGLYSLTLRSRKPEAKKFKRWITHELVPAVLRDGYYQMSKATLPAGGFSAQDVFNSMFEVSDVERKQIAVKAANATLKLINLGGDKDTVDNLCRYYEGKLKYKEMATLMNVSERTVSSWIGLLRDAGIITPRKSAAKALRSA